MSEGDLEKQWAEAYLSGGNMAYVDGLYEDYLADPNSVSEAWRDTFDRLPKRDGIAQDTAHRPIRDQFLKQAQMPKYFAAPAGDGVKQYRVTQLLNAYRAHGHHKATLDPLGTAKRHDIPSLELAYHDLSDADLSAPFIGGRNFSSSPMPLKDIIQALKETYCGSIGIEYMHIANIEERDWLQTKMEGVRGKPTFTNEEKVSILKSLIEADGLERYLGTRYVGQKRFSLEGGDALIPMLKQMIEQAGQDKVNEVVMGMAHRGRLNVLVNVLGKEPNALFEEFEGKVHTDISGDVKYHKGYSSDIKTKSGQILHIALAFNPSHLEIIGPVIEGSTRSRQRRRNDLIEKRKVVPIIIHGDAAFSGQGVVMETFNFSQARGYCTGGTVHIVINNQIGFTTSNPLDSRSTLYCTDVAKMVQAPVIHVNGEDPEAAVFAIRLAFEYRMKFKKDVVLDLVCYRRHGHNEADEPFVTQPVMYAKIKQMKPLKDYYSTKLIEQSVIDKKTYDGMNDYYRDCLDTGKAVVELVTEPYKDQISIDWEPYFKGKWTDKADTAISKEKVAALSKTLMNLPDDFTLHPVVKKILDDRQQMSAGKLDMNWGFAEIMAYASLLDEGFGVRLSGQDSGRGTFAHRHAVLHDQKTGEDFIPLSACATNPVRPFLVIDSVLSEEAVLAFEYGYASSEPHSLVIWEAQFGDFANGAQVVIDQFISSGEQKWNRLCGLVMLLPHGYEGQGPEHSSARLERYMQLCAQQNMQVCTPTTPAQIFHLLRRQIIRDYRKPLIIMSPKSLLRHKLATSPISELTNGEFHNVIPEIDKLEVKKVRTVVLCCGKVYYDLLQKRRDESLEHVAIIRIEQLYPFPKADLKKELAKYEHASDIVWCQEEPKNQGVWFSSQHNIIDCLSETQTLRYAGRGFAAAPAVGSPILHAKQQQALVHEALTGKKNNV
ncbi:2-oxoglutarate dehydrogenase E1 component [Legionella sp. W05-934-2]|jgi:2-oxoglutarate dehydrogenase E1 component|uniref:2-oxoglutarate dehydrogenase E1 component n=1 Tax=Legionella sp. W05-934-2 TaxID=1198649 RepID=UPI003461B66D